MSGQLYVDESRVGLDDSQVWRDEYDFTGAVYSMNLVGIAEFITDV